MEGASMLFRITCERGLVMKKMILLAICLSVMAALTGCSGTNADAVHEQGGEKTAPAVPGAPEKATEAAGEGEKSDLPDGGTGEAGPQGIDMLVKAFEGNGWHASVESEEPEALVLRGKGYRLAFNGPSEGTVTIYAYPDPAAAQEDISSIDAHGSTMVFPDRTQYVTWKNVPHFYSDGDLIIQYIGTDGAILELLTGLYGEPFAGGKTE